MSADACIDKQNVVYTYNGILLSLEKEGILTYSTSWNKPVTKRQMMYYLSYMRQSSQIQTENKMVVSRGWKEKKMGTYCLTGREFSVQGDETTSGNGLL